MAETELKQERKKGNWRVFLVSTFGFVFTAGLLAAAIIYRQEIMIWERMDI